MIPEDQDLITLFSEYCEIEWGRAHASPPESAQGTHPPFFVWRFKDVLEKPIIEYEIKKAVESYQSDIEWHIDLYRQRNWVLRPRKLFEFSEKLITEYGNKKVPEVEFGRKYPEFCQRCNKDVKKLLQHIKQHLEEGPLSQSAQDSQ